MAVQLNSSLNPLVNGVYVLHPNQLSHYFLANPILHIPPETTLHFSMNTSTEWSNSNTQNLHKALQVFREYLRPLGKSCALVTQFDENIKLEPLDDGFKLSASQHGFKVIVV